MPANRNSSQPETQTPASLTGPVFVAENQPLVWSLELKNSPGQVFLYLAEISPLADSPDPIFEANIESSDPVTKRLAIPRRGSYVLSWTMLAGGNWQSQVEVTTDGAVAFRLVKSSDGSKPKKSGYCVVVVS